MKSALKRALIVSIVMTLSSNFIFSQEAQPFPKSVVSNTTIEKGIYNVKGTNVVSANATLTIAPGTQLLFDKNARIEIRGGLKMQGAANDFVDISSLDHKNQGVGFIFTEGSYTDIDINYCKFHDLIKPILLNKNWSRRSIKIKHSEFKNLHGKGVYLEIQELDKILTDNLVNINISNNTFANNSGSILLSEAAGDLLQITITNNVFSRNEFIGRDLNGIFTTPLFLNYNVIFERGREPIIQNNSICNNYGSLMLEDTVEFFSTHLTVVGSADFLNVNGNYFGDDASEELDAYTDRVASNTRAPLLQYNDLLTKPKASNNGHIYKIGVNGIRIDNKSLGVEIDEHTNLIELVLNRPVKPSKEFKITYIFLDDDTLRYEDLKHKLELTSGNLKAEIAIKDRIIKMREFGYIQIEGLQDENGFNVPTVNIGLKNFLIENRIFIMGYNDFVKIPKLVQSTPRIYYTGDAPVPPGNVSDTGDIFIPSEIQDPEDALLRIGYWDIGILTGNTMYFGDLAYTDISLYLPNARPNIGFRAGYSFSEKFRMELSQNNMVITGSDDRSSIVGKKRGTNFERGLSFRTWIIDLGINAEYRLSRFRKISSVVPSFYIGVSGYYYNPQAQVDGVYYDLRPVGSEGQLTKTDREAGKIYAYNRFDIAIPMGIKLTRHINDKTLISASYTYNKLFTDYLDDVSTGTFQSDEDLIRNNPNLGTVAVGLANPNGLTPGKQRSSSADYDGYSYMGFTITRKLSN